MAILYGTQSNGETLPVQVNEFGQLVAQPLSGSQGPQGPQGPEGPEGPQGPEGEPGSAGWITTKFTPEYELTDGGSAIFEYFQRSALQMQLGSFVEIVMRIETQNVAITDARGRLCMTGFPPLISGYDPRARQNNACCTWSTGFKNFNAVFARLSYAGNYVYFRGQDKNGDWMDMPTTALKEGVGQSNNFLACTVVAELATPEQYAAQLAAARELGEYMLN